MTTNEFTKRWDHNHGFTYEEALDKVHVVNEAFDVSNSKSCWNPARFVPDPCKKDGYKVIITTKK